MKRRSFFILTAVVVLILTACGITEELEQSKTATKELHSTLASQKKIYTQLTKKIEAIIPAVHIEEQEHLYENEQGTLYKNIKNREELLKKLAGTEKQLHQLQSQLERIVKRNSVDVDNKKIKNIIKSLAIILNNYESLEVYSETGFEQEKELYANLTEEDAPEQASIVERTYGSILLVVQEAQANIDYTNNLIQEYLAAIPKQK